MPISHLNLIQGKNMKILSLASMLSIQSPNLSDKFKNDDILVISPLKDTLLNAEFIKCEIGSVSYALALICQNLLNDEFFDELDTGYLSGESNIGEEEISSICEFIKDIKFCIVSDEIFAKNPSQTKEMLNLLSTKFGFDLLNLNGEKITLSGKLYELDELDSFDGAVVFTHSKFDEFRGGKFFAMASKLRDGSEVVLKTKQKEIKTKFNLDNDMQGTIAMLGSSGLEYGFEIVNIK